MIEHPSSLNALACRRLSNKLPDKMIGVINADLPSAIVQLILTARVSAARSPRAAAPFEFTAHFIALNGPVFVAH